MDLRKPDQFRKYLKSTTDYHKRRAEVAKRLLAKYNLEELAVATVAQTDTTKVSRFYPIVKQTVAMLAFKAPKMTMSVEGGDTDATRAALLLERAADEALEIMELKTELQQIIFDALFFFGVGKLDYNRANDAIAPYRADTEAQNDFTAFSRVNPFLVYIDPMAPPHRPEHASVIIEKKFVPFEFVKKDERYSQRAKIKPMADLNSSIMQGDSMLGSDLLLDNKPDDQQTLQELLANEMVCLYEVHDRWHRSLITYAEGVDGPIQAVDHPFAKVNDPPEELLLTAQLEGIPFQFEKADSGFLCVGGTPFFIFHFDQTDQSAYPTPPLAYVEDLQDMVTEAQSRRRALVNNQPLFGLVNEAEVAHNDRLGHRFRTAKDRDLVPVLDHKNFAEAPLARMTPDQLTLEADARAYEEEVLHLAEANAGQPKRTATEAALISTVATLNREFAQDRVAQMVKDVVISTFNIFGDPRYTPEQFQVNINPDGAGEMAVVMERAEFLLKYKITVDAGSVQPLAERMERDETLSLAQLLLSVPEANRIETLKMAIHAHRHPDPDKLLNDQAKADVVQVVALENMLIEQGQDPGVQLGMDHQGHVDGHAERVEQLQGVLQQLVQAVQVNPLDQQMAQQLARVQAMLSNYQQHMQAHNQAAEQEVAQISGSGSGTNGTAPLPPNPIESAVRSSAQKLGDAATAEAAQVTEGRPR